MSALNISVKTIFLALSVYKPVKGVFFQAYSITWSTTHLILVSQTPILDSVTPTENSGFVQFSTIFPTYLLPICANRNICSKLVLANEGQVVHPYQGWSPGWETKLALVSLKSETRFTNNQIWFVKLRLIDWIWSFLLVLSVL